MYINDKSAYIGLGIQKQTNYLLNTGNRNFKKIVKPEEYEIIFLLSQDFYKVRE